MEEIWIWLHLEDVELGISPQGKLALRHARSFCVSCPSLPFIPLPWCLLVSRAAVRFIILRPHLLPASVMPLLPTLISWRMRHSMRNSSRTMLSALLLCGEQGKQAAKQLFRTDMGSPAKPWTAAESQTYVDQTILMVLIGWDLSIVVAHCLQQWQDLVAATLTQQPRPNASRKSKSSYQLPQLGQATCCKCLRVSRRVCLCNHYFPLFCKMIGGTMLPIS